MKTNVSGPYLPIDSYLEEIVEQFHAKTQLILEAPPGAGKTTRLPLAVLFSSRFKEGQEIYVLVPRRPAARLAAIQAARLIAQRVGETVGYQFRFEKCAGPHTRLWYLTEGTFLRKFMADPTLKNVGAVIVDEFHERHLQGDAALALIRRLRQSRPEILLGVMSATIDARSLKRYLIPEKTAHIQLPDAPYALEIRYQTPRSKEFLSAQVVRALETIWHEVTGDILIFLPGMREIRQAEEALSQHPVLAQAIILKLHGELSTEEQELALTRDQNARTKIILSTNIAESSVTIDGVRVVIDSGVHRLALHSPWTGVQVLHTRPIPKSSAIQRAGRAARQGKGVAIRLYSEDDYNTRPEQNLPEIRRHDLAEFLLQLFKLEISSDDFPWFETPPKESIEGAVQLLFNLGALAEGGRLTPAGKKMAGIPAHPRFSKLMLEAESRKIPYVAALSAAVIAESQFSSPNLLQTITDLLALPQLPFKLKRSMQNLLSLSGSFSREFPADWPLRLGEALFLAFPDRVFKLNERGLAQLYTDDVARIGYDDRESLQREKKSVGLALSVEEYNRNRTSARDLEISVFYQIPPETLLLNEKWVRDEKFCRFHAEKHRVDEISRLCYGPILLQESVEVPFDFEMVVSCLLEGLQEIKGEGRWPHNEVQESLKVRLQLLCDQSLASSHLLDQWPQALKKGLIAILAKQGVSSRSDLVAFIHPSGEASGYWGRMATLEAEENFLACSLNAEVAKTLTEEVPLFIPLPKRKRIKVNYAEGRPPWIEAMVQDFFGMEEVPQLLRRKLAISVHLLTPARRPMAVTSDLRSFWRNHYPKLRSEYQRRYPHHDWREDPLG
ncbi:MAG: ATP-dependent RNA helicase [Bdellovibrio sp.]|nr:ATP-dependent RNA helicase [Bdellovibrio sp.]